MDAPPETAEVAGQIAEVLRGMVLLAVMRDWRRLAVVLALAHDEATRAARGEPPSAGGSDAGTKPKC